MRIRFNWMGRGEWSLFLFCIAIGWASHPRDAQAIQFWLSDSAAIPAVNLAGHVPNLVIPRNSRNCQVHIWGRPDTGAVMQNFSLNLRSSNTSALEFTDVDIYNNTVGHQRYEYIFEPIPTAAPSNPDFVRGIQGFTVLTDAGIFKGWGPSFGTADPHYDSNSARNAGLIATVDFNVTGAVGADSSLFLQIGANGMNQVNQSSAAANVVFGRLTDAPRNADTQRGLDSATADATLRIGAIADLNGDGAWDAADAAILFANWGGRSCIADITGDGAIDAADAGQLFSAWTGDSALAVPEPVVGFGLAVGLAALVLPTRARRSRCAGRDRLEAIAPNPVFPSGR